MTASTGERDNREDAFQMPPGPGDIPADTFAARLVLARFHAGRLSIERAAERCGLNSGNWVRWEDGALPRDKVEVAAAVAEGLDINEHWLLHGGPLLPARGRPTKRPGRLNAPYAARPVRPQDTRPNGRPLTALASPARPVRRPRIIDRAQPVAV